MKKFKLGVIGAGFMANAIINGAVNSGFLTENEIIISDINSESLSKFDRKAFSLTTDNERVLNESEYVLFAVKPQNFASTITSTEFSCNKFISIMAGVKISSIKSTLKKQGIKVARCMPNTPCSVGYGAVGIALSDFSDEKDRKFVCDLFSSFSQTVILDENKLNAVTGISGSAPAYFYLFVKCLVDAGIKQGLSEDDAKKLAVNTMIGSGKMIFKNTDKTLDELIKAVCSKGGTTIEAIKVFEECGLNEITDKAVSACVDRACELEKLI